MTIVTLTSDYGNTDYYVPRLKGAILSAQSGLNIIDISHQISRYDINHGAVVLANSYSSFPLGSIHILSVDGTDYRGQDYIFFSQDNHFFIGPNNGIFSIVFDEWTERIYQSPRMQATTINKTVARIISGITRSVSLPQLGKLVAPRDVVKRLPLVPVLNYSFVRTTIIHVDHFGNLFLNIKKYQLDALRKDRSFRIYFQSGEPLTVIHKHYHDVPIGDVVCRFNEVGYLEIGVHLGKADAELGLRIGDTIQIEFDE